MFQDQEFSTVLAAKEWPPIEEGVGFFEAVFGTSITWVFWTIFVGWASYQSWRCVKKGPLACSPGGGLLIAPTLAILEFALGLTVSLRTFMFETGAYSPGFLLLDIWYCAYAAVWVLIWGAIATGVVVSVKFMSGRRQNGDKNVPAP